LQQYLNSYQLHKHHHHVHDTLQGRRKNNGFQKAIMVRTYVLPSNGTIVV
jgi:hypothetical protein